MGTEATVPDETAERSAPGAGVETDARHRLETAVAFFQTGAFDGAEAQIKTFLREFPEQPDALHLMGLIAHRRGVEESAATYIERAVAAQPDNPAFHNNLAQTYEALGRFEDAESELRQALDFRPDYAGAHYNLANLVRRRGDLDQAIEHYKQAIALEPGFGGAYVNYAQALLDRGRAQEAEALARQAIAVAPNLASAHGALGTVLLAVGDTFEAAEACRHAISLDPALAESHLCLGNALIANGAAEDAIEPLRAAVDLMPDRADAHNSLGVALTETGETAAAEERFMAAISLDPLLAEPESNLSYLHVRGNCPEKAFSHARRATEIDPAFPSAWINLGSSLLISENPYGALEACVRAADIAARAPEAHVNLASALDVLARDEDALGAFDEAIALDPDNADAHFGRALTLLKLGNYTEGFAEYEWRIKLGSDTIARANAAPWDGSTNKNATLLLHAEQGYGDTIQFVRFVPCAAERVGRVILVCPPAVVRLLDGTPGVDEIVSNGDPLPRCDMHAPLGSLPHILRTTLETLPAVVPYIPAPVEAWALDAPSGTRLKVGLVWSGGEQNRINRRRSCPFTALTPLLEQTDIAFYSLQLGPHARDVATAPEGAVLQNLSPRIGDFADTAAALAGLDLVLSIDTGVAHLAGALGRPVWTMLSYGGDWRYLRERADSPWYPTMRIFRQPEPGDWPSVIAEIAKALHAHQP